MECFNCNQKETKEWPLIRVAGEVYAHLNCLRNAYLSVIGYCFTHGEFSPCLECQCHKTRHLR